MAILGGPKGSNFKGELPDGDYEFPFEFHLPPNAPPTMIHFVRDGTFVELEYLVIGCVPNYYMVKESVVVTSRMPSSQYISRFPVASRPSQFERTSCCCIENGRTEVSVELPFNAYVFGKDKSISGVVVINNAECTTSCESITAQLVRAHVRRLYEWDMSGKLEKEDRYTDNRFHFNMITTVRNVDVAAGEKQLKRFNFVLPLPGYDNKLASCYRGINIDYFYELQIFVDGDKAHSMPIIMASGEDPTNRCPPIDMAVPYQGMLPGAYPRSVYPHGQVAGVVMPPQPPANIPQPPRRQRGSQRPK